jgi:hypothetical protein
MITGHTHSIGKSDKLILVPGVTLVFNDAKNIQAVSSTTGIYCRLSVSVSNVLQYHHYR